MRVKVKRKNPVCNLCGKEMDFWDGQQSIQINGYLGYAPCLTEVSSTCICAVTAQTV